MPHVVKWSDLLTNIYKAMFEPYRNKRIVRTPSNLPLDYFRAIKLSKSYHSLMEKVQCAKVNEALSTPNITLFGPHADGILLKFSNGVDGKNTEFEVYDFEYDVFSQIKFWLEDLCDKKTDSCTAIIDSEGFLYMLHYEKLPFLEDDIKKMDSTEKGIFMVLNELDNSKYWILCNKKDLIKAFYEAVMYFSSGENINTPSIMVTWDNDEKAYPNTEEGRKDFEADEKVGFPKWKGHKLFQDRFRSKIVEKYLSRRK